jgi:hypothetical protein
MNLVDIYNNNPEFVRQLGGFRMIETNKLVGSVDAEGNTLLHKAAMNNDMTTFNSIKTTLPENLQERSRFINAQNANGDTAAHVAVRNANYAMVTAIKHLGGDLSIANKNNEYIMSTEGSDVFQQNQAGAGLDSDNFPAALSSTQPYVAPKVPKYESPSFNSPDNLDGFSSDIFISNKAGGAVSHNSDAYDPASLDEISSEFNIITGGAAKINGGGKSISGTRTLYFEDMITSDSSMYHEGGSSKQKESTKIHDEVIRMIQDLGYSEDDARVLKAACYRLVKDKYPELNNLERAKKMLDYCKSDVLANIPLDETREAIRKNREAKMSMKGKKSKDDKKPEKKASAKKASTKKATKKASAKKSK